MRTLPDFCKNDAVHISRIADILTQLLQTGISSVINDSFVMTKRFASSL